MMICNVILLITWIVGVSSELPAAACPTIEDRGPCRMKDGCTWINQHKICVDKELAKPKYFLLDVEGFNCKNQALNYVTSEMKCKKAARILGIDFWSNPGSGAGTQKYCGAQVVDGKTRLTFNPSYSEDLVEKTTDTGYQICASKVSPWVDETCGRELCIPEELTTDDPKVFDFSEINWVPANAGANIGFLKSGEPWKDGVALFNMTQGYTQHFHYHTNFHSGWILKGQKSTWNLDQDEFDPKYLKTLGTYFAVPKGVWHTEKQEDPAWTIIYLRFVEKFDYIYPNVNNKAYIVTPEDSGIPEYKRRMEELRR